MGVGATAAYVVGVASVGPTRGAVRRAGVSAGHTSVAVLNVKAHALKLFRYPEVLKLVWRVRPCPPIVPRSQLHDLS